MNKELEPWEQALLDVEMDGYGQVLLLVDGLNVTYSFGRGDKNKLYFMFYVDGNWKGEYSRTDNAFGKRFGCAKNQRMSAKDIKNYSAFYNKAEMKKKIADYNRCIGYMPTHNSAKSVISVLKKNNVSIALREKEVEQ
jgi:hypothetical protein